MQIYSQSEIITIVTRNGFVAKRQNGSHITYVRGNESLVLVSGGGKHGTQSVIFARLIREYKLDVRVLDKKFWKSMQR